MSLCHGTVVQLFALARMVEESWEFSHQVYPCFMDLERAYIPKGMLGYPNSVPRVRVSAVMQALYGTIIVNWAWRCSFLFFGPCTTLTIWVMNERMGLHYITYKWQKVFIFTRWLGSPLEIEWRVKISGGRVEPQVFHVKRSQLRRPPGRCSVEVFSPNINTPRYLIELVRSVFIGISDTLHSCTVKL